MIRQATTVTILALAALLAAPAPSPVHLAYVTSGSMTPTLSTGDGYVLVATGEYEAGDIVTFRSADGDEYVTHRVVGAAADGLITKGDGNPSTDQTGGAPPVSRDAVLGEVLTVGGRPLVVPALGTALTGVRRYGALLLGAVGVIALTGRVLGGRRGIPPRPLVYVKDVTWPLFVGLTGVLVVTMVLATSVHTMTYVATTSPTENPTTITTDEPATRSLRMAVRRAPFTTVVLDADGATITRRAVTDPATELEAIIPAQDDPGPHDVVVRVHTYPATLPEGALRTLHGVHPVVAWVCSAGVVFAPILSAYVVLFDGASAVRLRDERWLQRLGGRR